MSALCYCDNLSYLNSTPFCWNRAHRKFAERELSSQAEGQVVWLFQRATIFHGFSPK